MSNFKVMLNEKEVEVKNNIPNSQLAAQRHIDNAKKAIAMPGEEASEKVWGEYGIALEKRRYEVIAENADYLAKLTGVSKKEINEASQKEINEAIYLSDCELLDLPYKTREQRDKEAGILAEEEDSEKN